MHEMRNFTIDDHNVCQLVCLSVTLTRCAKMAERIEILLGRRLGTHTRMTGSRFPL